MPSSLPRLPISIQNFEVLRQGGYLYVDKTELIHHMVTMHTACFLSRPRRFGKSLLISTLESLFEGRRDLFEGLWIDSSDWQWEACPVVRLDMSKVVTQSPEAATQSIAFQLKPFFEKYQLDYAAELSISLQLSSLISQLSKKSGRPIAVLIDEYDKPIIDHLIKDDADVYRQLLRSFYGILKSQSHQIRFLLLTGVSKFSKVSIFSELNHLKDLTMHSDFATLLGYTQAELEKSFEGCISGPDQLSQIKNWYNGYRFSEAPEKVYNPFSTLNYFQDNVFRNYWFESGTPSFLPELLKAKNYDVESLEDREITSDSFSSYDIDDLNPLALLFQAGYLTIAKHNPEENTYMLGYPNYEVEQSFIKQLLKTFGSQAITDVDQATIWLRRNLTGGDMEAFFTQLQSFYAGIPYDIHIKAEKYYQTIFYLIFKLLGVQVRAEERTHVGRADAIIELKDRIYIFEFKLDQPIDAAVAQLKAKNYGQKYTGKPVTQAAISFSTALRNIEAWKII